MQEILKRLIDIASAEVGYHEGYNNDNKYGAEYGFNNVAWCVEFCWWICKHAEVPFPTTAHCNQVEAYAREHGQWVTAPYHVGDFVIWDYDRNGERDHIGLVIEANGNAITTIEGNSGDAVRKNLYVNLNNIVGAYRPDYGAQDPADDDSTSGEELPDIDVGNIEPEISLVLPDDPRQIAALQYALYVHGYEPANSRMRNGDFDGEIGPGTINAATFCALDHNIETYEDLWKWLGGC